MSVFDVMGPIMVGPSSSHTAGAVRLGHMARCIYGREPHEARLVLLNSFAQTGAGHGTQHALLGGVLGLRVDDERLRQSPEIARERGMKVVFEYRMDPHVHPNCAEIYLDGEGFRLVGESVGGGAIRVVEIQGHPVDFTGKHDLLLLSYDDRPGMLGFIGDQLAAASVNIAYVQITRDKNTEQALAVLKLDEAPPGGTLERLRANPHMQDCTFVRRAGSEDAGS